MQEPSKPKSLNLIRWSKAILVCAVALYFSLIVFNNLISYSINFNFTTHVLSMDTTFSDNGNMWRSINSSILHHIFYIIIIIVEAVIAVLCWTGGYRLFKSRKDVIAFKKAKSIAVIGLTIGLLLWFTGFLTIGESGF